VTIPNLTKADYPRSTRDCADTDADVIAEPRLDADGDVESIAISASKLTVNDQDSEACDYRGSLTITSFEKGLIRVSYNGDFENISPTASSCDITPLVREFFGKGDRRATLNSDYQILRWYASLGDSERCTLYFKQ